MTATIGSLLEGLKPGERSDIILVVFIPHTEPSTHPLYGEPWLHQPMDHFLTYDLDESENQAVRAIEDEGGAFLAKGLYDHSYLLSKCAEQCTPYIAIFEDDTIAMDGWFHRTIITIREAEQQTSLRPKHHFLYLRLFYTERFLEWNSEEWLIYLSWSGAAAGALAVVLLVLPKTRPATKLCHTFDLCHVVLLLYCALITAILLFFALGRMTVLLVPIGVRKMAKFGCCSQALVFPRTKALELVSYFRNRRTGFMDVLPEEYANLKTKPKFATTPSLVQHVGRESCKRTDRGPVLREEIWSFRFERFDGGVLRKEHELHVNEGSV